MSITTTNLTNRVSYYQLAVLADGGTARTFSRKIYRIKGLIARDIETNEVKKLSSIYYEIRTVKDKHQNVIAKRRNPDDELKRVLN